MTKDEAIAQIRIIRTSHDDLNASQEKIREVIDQIDQPPAEFSVSELFDLIGKNGSRYWLEIDWNGEWKLSNEASDFDATGQGIDSLRDKLIELAKPPEPKTVTMDVPIDWAKTWSAWGTATGDSLVARDNARAALEKAGVKR